MTLTSRLRLYATDDIGRPVTSVMQRDLAMAADAIDKYVKQNDIIADGGCGCDCQCCHHCMNREHHP